MWNLENGIGEFICRSTDTDVENGLVDTVG